jgi:hypothetical protein
MTAPLNELKTAKYIINNILKNYKQEKRLKDCGSRPQTVRSPQSRKI